MAIYRLMELNAAAVSGAALPHSTRGWLQAVRMGKLVKNLPVLLWLLRNLCRLGGLILLICYICDFCIFQVSGLLILRL